MIRILKQNNSESWNGTYIPRDSWKTKKPKYSRMATNIGFSAILFFAVLLLFPIFCTAESDSPEFFFGQEKSQGVFCLARPDSEQEWLCMFSCTPNSTELETGINNGDKDSGTHGPGMCHITIDYNILPQTGADARCIYNIAGGGISVESNVDSGDLPGCLMFENNKHTDTGKDRVSDYGYLPTGYDEFIKESLRKHYTNGRISSIKTWIGKAPDEQMFFQIKTPEDWFVTAEEKTMFSLKFKDKLDLSNYIESCKKQDDKQDKKEIYPKNELSDFYSLCESGKLPCIESTCSLESETTRLFLGGVTIFNTDPDSIMRVDLMNSEIGQFEYFKRGPVFISRLPALDSYFLGYCRQIVEVPEILDKSYAPVSGSDMESLPLRLFLDPCNNPIWDEAKSFFYIYGKEFAPSECRNITSEYVRTDTSFYHVVGPPVMKASKETATEESSEEPILKRTSKETAVRFKVSSIQPPQVSVRSICGQSVGEPPYTEEIVCYEEDLDEKGRIKVVADIYDNGNGVNSITFYCDDLRSDTEESYEFSGLMRHIPVTHAYDPENIETCDLKAEVGTDRSTILWVYPDSGEWVINYEEESAEKEIEDAFITLITAYIEKDLASFMRSVSDSFTSTTEGAENPDILLSNLRERFGCIPCDTNIRYITGFVDYEPSIKRGNLTFKWARWKNSISSGPEDTLYFTREGKEWKLTGLADDVKFLQFTSQVSKFDFNFDEADSQGVENAGSISAPVYKIESASDSVFVFTLTMTDDAGNRVKDYTYCDAHVPTITMNGQTIDIGRVEMKYPHTLNGELTIEFYPEYLNTEGKEMYITVYTIDGNKSYSIPIVIVPELPPFAPPGLRR